MARCVVVDSSRIAAFPDFADIPAEEPGGQCTASVVARTTMRVLSLSGQDFDRIRARVPEVERPLRSLGLERTG